MPDTLTNPILLGSLLIPLGVPLYMRRAEDRNRFAGRERSDDPPRHDPDRDGNVLQDRVAEPAAPPLPHRPERRRFQGPRLGDLPLARRDIERLRQMVGLQRRISDVSASPRAQRALAHRSIFREALTWLEIHGDAPEIVEHWKALLAESPAPEPSAEGIGEVRSFQRRRRRRRRRRPFVPTGS